MLKKGGSNSSKYLPSALTSHVTSPRTENDIQDLKRDVDGYNKFLDFLANQNVSLLKKKLLEFRGTHNPIAYKPQFNFQQRWEKMTRTTEEVNFNLLMSSNMFCYVFSFIIMIHNFILIWFLSVFRLYSISDSDPFFQVGTVFILVDICLKIYIYAEHYKANNQTIKIQKIIFSIDFLTLVIGDLWCVIYYICIISGSSLSNVNLNQMMPFDIITMFFLIKRAYEIYNYLVILIIATKYKNEMTIFDLAIKMLCILHFFVNICLIQSMLLYGIALTSPDQNWMTRIEVHNSTWDTKYIYTLYFACTTMFTVGYGDILPTNKGEIVTIMCIEALGMALFGYIVNEVGIALGNMRKKRTNLEKDIYNAERISKLYELNPDLGKKVRDYVISNQIAQEELGISEENDFLLKLNQQLRDEVKQSHQLKIIKTSLFFITHWSKKIQIEMAKKLQKCIFAPNENIHSKGQVDRLFVMVKGKIEVFTEKNFGTKISCRKLLKVIQKAPGQEVFNNVFGVTSFFSGKSNRLKAVAKQSTVCYTLGYEDIKDFINEDSNDFEYFHYLRQKFQFSKIPEKWEAPTIVNIRQNYSPVIFYIIKKHTKLCKKQSRHKSWTRKEYVNKRICQMNFGKNQSQSFYAESYDDITSESQKSYNSQNPGSAGSGGEIAVSNIQMQICGVNKSDQMLNQTPMWEKTKACIQQIINSNQIISNRSYRRKYWTSQREERYEQKVKQFLEDHITLTSEFEIGKNYNRFFPKFNRKQTIQRLVKAPELIQKQCFVFHKNSVKSYQTTLKKTIRRNFSQIYKDQLF